MQREVGAAEVAEEVKQQYIKAKSYRPRKWAPIYKMLRGWREKAASYAKLLKDRLAAA